APSDDMAKVEQLLRQAQDQFRAGNRDDASHSLAAAAQAYERLGRFDSAVTIYRSLGRGAQASLEIMHLWLANCEKRDDRREAAQVACELGDRTLNDGDEAGARGWFERAAELDPEQETARRRLQRLNGGSPSGTLAPLPEPSGPGANGDDEQGRVQVAVGRGEAVTFDLSGLLAEFQRGVEAQLAGDAQSHYDLGMTYREMGLHEQAMESFRVAQGDPRLAVRAQEMIGRCLADEGKSAEAAAEFERALARPDLDPVGAAELHYHLGLARLAAGDAAGALEDMEYVARELPGFEDVDQRLAELRAELGRAA
ncbi:MAG TPA: tetratricopeptide repeat protein, partial [Candidatus Eisenbacteria bacterium]|nr:tetratricopeptide repeat protein [Candidatus Eisenbacteria bacterium]